MNQNKSAFGEEVRVRALNCRRRGRRESRHQESADGNTHETETGLRGGSIVKMMWKKGLLRLTILSLLWSGAEAGFRTTAAAEEGGGPVSMEPVRLRTDKWAIVPLAGSAPTIDGQSDETVWQQAPTLDDFATAYYELELAGEASYRLLYDEDYLYVTGKIGLAEASSLNKIELVVQPQGPAEPFYVAAIPVDPSPEIAIATVWNPVMDNINVSTDTGRVNLSSFSYASTADSQYWQVEAAIPLEAVAETGVAPGDEWRFNIVHVNNLYESPLSSWIPLRNTDHWHAGGVSGRINGELIVQDRLGSLYFGRLPDRLAAPPLTGGRWEPAGVELRYAGYTEKELDFETPFAALSPSDVKLYWKEPLKAPQPLTGFTLNQTGNVVTVEFAHPPMREYGVYELQVAVSSSAGSVKAAVLTLDREHVIAAGLAAMGDFTGTPNPSPTAVAPAPASQATQDLLDLIPPQPGFRYVGLPEMPELFPDNLYTLSSNGRQLVSTRTGTVYPNSSYPETEQLVVTNGKGETVTIPFYEDGNGKRYSITGHLWYLQKNRALVQTRTLAQSDPLGAARVLDRFVDAFERYNPTVDRIGGNTLINHSANVDSGPPYAYWGGIWDRWWYNHLTRIVPLADAYTRIKQTDAFAVLSAELGYDVERRLIDDLFRPSVDYALTYMNRYSNMTFEIWSGLAAIGKAINEPDYIHRVVESTEDFISNMYLSDGSWQEVTMSYHDQTVGDMQAIFNALQGWSDPVGYVSPRTGVRFDNLNIAQQFPIVAKAQALSDLLAYPNGKVLPIMDTHASQNARQSGADRGATLLPAAKVGRLAGGQGLDRTQAILYFQPKYGHVHQDPLNLNLYARRQELLPDIGYTHNTFYRWFALSTMGHNTVVVNSANAVNSAEGRHGGNVRLFEPGDGGLFQAIRADYESAYAVADEYSREPWFVPFADGSGEQGYVLDLFRVSGGSRHEYTLQGDANRDAVWETDMALTDYGPYLLPPGTPVVEPVSNSDSGSAGGHYPGYIYVRDVKQAALDGDRYEVTLSTEQDNMQITGLLEAGGNELYLGRSPSLRSIRLNGSSMDNNDEAVKYDMPKLVHRRDGTNLRSTFATVMEPFASGSAPRIEAIDRLPLDEAPDGAVAIQVAYGDTTDILLSNPHHPNVPVVVGDIEMVGEMGMIRLIDGQVSDMALTGGTLLRKGGRSLQGDGVISGTVTDTLRVANGDAYDALVTDAQVSDAAIGRYVIVSHPDGSTTGYQIGSIVREPGRTILVLAEYDPGSELAGDGSSRQTFYPHKSWTGPHTFAIKTASGGPGTELSPVVLQAVELQAGDGDGSRQLTLGDSVQLSVYGWLSNGRRVPLPAEDVVFSSSANGIVTVNAQGAANAVGEGTAFVTAAATVGDVTRQTQLALSAQASAPGGLLPGPSLAVSGGPAYPEVPVVLSFADDPAWRAGIGGVTVNGQSVSASVYSVTAGQLTLASQLFPTEGTYWITVRSPGYRDAAVEQRVVARSALSGLQPSRGTLTPRFSALTADYALGVGAGSGSLTVTASTYDPNAVITVAGQVYASGEPIGLEWDGSVRTVELVVSSAGYPAKAYSLTLYPGQEAVATGSINGTIYTSAGPIVGALVRLTGNSSIAAETDASGAYRLDDVPQGYRRVTAVHPRYQLAVSDAVYVVGGQTAHADVTLTRRLPPVLSGTPAIGVRIGDAVPATSSDDGYIYLVPAGTPANRAAIEAAVAVGGVVYGAYAPTVAGVPVSLSTSLLSAGRYVLYAIQNDTDAVSAAVSLVLVEDGVALIDDSDPIVQYSGSTLLLNNTAYEGGTMMLLREKGGYAEIPFYGTSAKLVTDIHTARGKGRVYVDGEYAATIDFYGTPIRYKQVLFETGVLPEGVHTLRIEALWERDPSSTGYNVPFDALRVQVDEIELTQVTAGPVELGDPVAATSPVAGTLYLVPQHTAATRAAIEAAAANGAGSSAPVSAGIAGAIPTGSLPVGWYKVYAISATGRVSLGSAPIALVDASTQPTVIDDGHALVGYTGTWQTLTNTAYRGGTMRIASAEEASVDIPFYGTGATLITDIHRARGIGRILVDGVPQTDFDFYSPVIRYQQSTFDTGTLPLGWHTLRIEVLRQRHPDSTGFNVPFDALQVR